jgi:hypothetical protein
LTSILIIAVFLPPVQNPPKGPITINAGPFYSDSLNKTIVIFRIPEKTITVEVTYKLKNDNNTLFMFVMLPYTIVSYSGNAILNGNQVAFSKDMGNLTEKVLVTPYGSSIINATLDLDYTQFNFILPDQTIGIQIDMTVKESLFSIEDLLASTKTATYTFFGDNSGVYTDEMSPYMGINNTPTLNAPFIVQIELPHSYYLSTSQPPPIEYYIKQDNRWIMFSMDFLNGRYAQTLAVNLENPAYQSLRELLIFFIGIFSTLSITFGLEAWTSHIEDRKNSDHE